MKYILMVLVGFVLGTIAAHVEITETVELNYEVFAQ